MSIIIDGTSGITTPSETNTGTLSVTGVTTLTGGLNAPLPVLSGGTGVTASPCFSAWASTNQTAPSLSTWTKVNFDTEEFDTNNNFSSSRFTPLVAGYYQFNFSVYFNTSSTSLTSSTIYKNGGTDKIGFINTGANPTYSSGGSSLIYMNGTTDYAEVYIYLSNSTALYGARAYTYFQASMVRGA